jgi:hypothetical protein
MSKLTSTNLIEEAKFQIKSWSDCKKAHANNPAVVAMCNEELVKYHTMLINLYEELLDIQE